MYKINQETNNVKALRKRTFSELGFREREHLQEWVAKNPLMLGEELLIIQKEFDGWNETRERIDLLALDKDGSLVVIENKLDDSGRDVAWQAMKYAAYCSSLTKNEIADIFQKYLDKQANDENSRDVICSFYNASSFEELALNEGFNQRIILVGARFRPEVTATCLWMINHSIDVKCIRIVPYSENETLFLNIDQIIPPPEAKDYMVKVGNKEIDEKSSRGQNAERHYIREKFFSSLLQNLSGEAKKVYANRTAGKDHWLSGSTGISGVSYNFVFLKNGLRVSIDMQRAESEQNKFLFDALENQKLKIEAKFGAPFKWMRLDEKISSRIQYEVPFDSFDTENWDTAISWFDTNMNKLMDTLQAYLNDHAQNKEYLSA
jgi:hypothetical protein